MSVSAPDMLVTTCYLLSSLFTVKLSLHFPEKKTTCDRSAVSYIFDTVSRKNKRMFRVNDDDDDDDDDNDSNINDMYT
jgi:hypothetical protein